MSIEIATQLTAFIDTFGHLPDFVDGHQHVHLVPQVRGALLKVVAETAPDAWVRQCGRARGARRMRDAKALTLDMLSLGLEERRPQARHRHQSGLRRRLRFQHQDAVRENSFRASCKGCRKAAW